MSRSISKHGTCVVFFLNNEKTYPKRESTSANVQSCHSIEKREKPKCVYPKFLVTCKCRLKLETDFKGTGIIAEIWPIDKVLLKYNM